MTRSFRLALSAVILGVALAAAVACDDDEDGAPSDESRLDNLAALVEVASGFSSVRELLDYADAGAEAREAEGPAWAVTLSTVHGAKGLEWDCVIVVQAVDGQFPHARAESDDDYAEETRIEYVAVTRAAPNGPG